MQSSENAFVVLPSTYRHNEAFLNAVRPAPTEVISSPVPKSSETPTANPDGFNSGNGSVPQSVMSIESQPQSNSQSSRRSADASKSSRRTDGTRGTVENRETNEVSQRSVATASLSHASHPLSSHESMQTDPSSTPAQNESSIFFFPNVEFGIHKAKSLCALVSVGGMPNVLTPDERIAYLAHIFGDDTSFVRVVGGLLSFVVKNGVLNSGSRNDDIIHINSISYRNYCSVMKVSPVTLRALHVFSDDIHPVGRGGLRGKEGLSLYGLLKSCVRTPSGRLLLRSWLIYPSTDVSVIKERQFLVRCFLDRSNRALTVALRYALVGLKNVRSVIARIRRLAAGLGEWKGLYGCAKAFIAVMDALKVAVQQRPRLKLSPLIAKIISIREHDMREVVSWIDAVVDFEESMATGRLIVATSFSDEIDDLKRSYNGMDDFLTAISAQELKEMLERENCPKLTSLQVVYVPQVGFLVVLREEDVDEVGMGVWQEHGMSFVYHSKESGYHFRNERCRKLDDEIGDIHGAILDLESKAFRYLQTQVLSFCDSLCVMGDAVYELDCLQGLAACSNEYSWTLPHICDDTEVGELCIVDGRHALLENKVASFVPNSTYMKLGDVHVLTG